MSSRLNNASSAAPCKVFSPEELQAIEAAANELQTKATEGRLPKTCFHESRGRTGNLKRTKYFLGARCKPALYQLTC